MLSISFYAYSKTATSDLNNIMCRSFSGDRGNHECYSV